MAMGTTEGNNFLTHLFGKGAWTHTTPMYLSLHTANPGVNGASEVTDGNYARISVTSLMGTAGSKLISNSSAIAFYGASGVVTGHTVTHVGIWMALTSGTFRAGGALTSNVVLVTGEKAEFAIGDLDWQVS